MCSLGSKTEVRRVVDDRVRLSVFLRLLPHFCFRADKRMCTAKRIPLTTAEDEAEDEIAHEDETDTADDSAVVREVAELVHTLFMYDTEAAMVVFRVLAPSLAAMLVSALLGRTSDCIICRVDSRFAPYVFLA